MTNAGIAVPELVIILIIMMIILAPSAVLALVGLFMLLRSKPSGAASGESESSAITILKERYARGEINREQFEQMWNDLEAR